MLIYIYILFYINYIQYIYAITTSNTDVLALQSLYNATNGVNWAWKEDTSNNYYSSASPIIWNFDNITNSNPCGNNWQGVRCTCPSGSSICYVGGLDLVQYDMVGEIPPQLCDLDYIETLNLNNNNISGAIPLCLFTNNHINEIQINYNMLNESLPYINYATVYPNSTLTTLDLSYNYITGSIPVSLIQIITNTIENFDIK